MTKHDMLIIICAILFLCLIVMWGFGLFATHKEEMFSIPSVPSVVKPHVLQAEEPVTENIPQAEKFPILEVQIDHATPDATPLTAPLRGKLFMDPEEDVKDPQWESNFNRNQNN